MLASHLQENNLAEYRHLLSSLHRHFRGLTNREEMLEAPASLAAFLELYHFTSATDNSESFCPATTRGFTPLYYAAQAGNVPVLRELLSKPAVVAKINIKLSRLVSSTRYGIMGANRATPLLAACFYSDSPASVELLVRHGADTKSTCDYGANFPQCPPIIMMASAQSNDCIRWWVDQRFEGFDIEEETGHGFSALFCAAIFGAGNSIETVKLLCDLGADYTKKTSAGQQFTTSASFSGDSEVIQYVISKGGGAMVDGLSTPNVTKNAFLRRVVWIFRLLYVSYVHA